MEDPKNPRKIRLYLPLLLSTALVAGIYLGSKVAPPSNQTIIFPSRTFSDINKLNEILNYIEDSYVDTINKKRLVETSIEQLLQSLDPHSYYISASDLQDVTDPLEGNFEGIGVEFRIVEDTVMVITALGGGPSEKAGIVAGDRIVRVNDTLVAGIGMSSDLIMKMLKGKKGTNVFVEVMRQGYDSLLEFHLVRGKIPIYSVDASYMVTNNIGYIKISRFGKTTYDEFIESTEKLKEQGLQKIIVDLRNNGGGYLNAATKIADEFLAHKELIVYTEGKSRARQSIFATSSGSLKNTEVYMLINENSASASEILAGAIQDNDRGMIIGRRSFGKGLVQEQLELPDGSAVRLTVARYYTPTGRSIQKPYGDNIEDYHMDTYLRFQHGEMYSMDSIKFPDSLQYVTPGGKVVYGGGGIMPDLFIPLNTASRNEYMMELNYNGVFQEFAFNYIDRHRPELDKFKTVVEFDKSFVINNILFNEFIAFARSKNVQSNTKDIKKFHGLMRNRVKANIAQNLWGSNGYLYIINQMDEMMTETVNLINK